MIKLKSQHLNQTIKNIQACIILICIILCFTEIIIPYFNTPNTLTEYTYILTDSNTHNQYNSKKQNIKKPIKDTIININSAAFNDLCAIGIPEKQAHILINYRNKGGVFYTKQDILKIYGLHTKIYNTIQDKIITGYTSKRNKKEQVVKKKTEKKPKKITKHINLNTCTAKELTDIYMIADKRAEEIITYRKKLGGFYNYNQLLEIYCIDSIAMNNIQKTCYIDTSQIKKININTTKFNTLLKHPYCNYYIAKDIFGYKKIIQKIKHISELEKENILNKEEYAKIKKYLTTF
ncbi:MAG: helix-hairpin-helix domain-containing protein [Bacteroidales bacterium]